MPAKSNVSLVGFMGSGKTASGQELARLLRFEFLDSDQLIQAEAGLTVAEIFEKHGEPKFREMEKALAEKMRGMKRTVWATGGGAWLNAQIRQLLQENSWSFWLKVSADQSWKRVSSHLSQRPLLARAADPLAEISRKLQERDATYALADFRVDTDHKTPREVAAEIMERIRTDKLLDKF